MRDCASSPQRTSFCSSDGSCYSWICSRTCYRNCCLVLRSFLSVHIGINQYVSSHLPDFDDCTVACSRTRCASGSCRSNDAWWSKRWRFRSHCNRIVPNVWTSAWLHHHLVNFHYRLDNSCLFLSAMASIIDKP